MADIQQIVVILFTSSADDAGTDGDVYLGIGGREFYLDTPEDDNEANNGQVSVLGPAATVSEPGMNDPRSPYKLKIEYLDRFPTYLRLAGDDHWKISMGGVWVYKGADTASMQFSHLYATPLDGSAARSKGMWLGPKAGNVLHLHLAGIKYFEATLRKAGLLDFVKKSLPEVSAPKRKSPPKVSAPKRKSPPKASPPKRRRK